MITKEEWRTCLRFPEYEVSNMGNVRRAWFRGRRINRPLKLYVDKFGYAHFYPSQNAIVSDIKMHHMVLETFISLRPIKHVCNHKNGKKTDNRAVNLEWVTQSENNFHAYRTGLSVCPDRKGVRNGRAKLKDEDIYVIRQLRKEGLTLQKIADRFDVDFSAIYRITKGKG